MDLKEGDVVLLDYTLHEDGGEPLTTSSEAKAQELGIHAPDKRYRPLTVTLGNGQLLPALERRIIEEAELGKAMTVRIAAKDAYGERDANLLRDIPMVHFRRQKVQPKVGMEVSLEERRGVVTRVAGGRVRVDLNPGLAGKDLRYEIEVRERLTEPKEKAEAVMAGFFGTEGHTVLIRDDAVVVEVPDQAKFDRQWQMHKFRLLRELRAAAGGLSVVLQETYPRHAPADEEE